MRRWQFGLLAVIVATTVVACDEADLAGILAGTGGGGGNQADILAGRVPDEGQDTASASEAPAGPVPASPDASSRAGALVRAASRPFSVTGGGGWQVSPDGGTASRQVGRELTWFTWRVPPAVLAIDRQEKLDCAVELTPGDADAHAAMQMVGVNLTCTYGPGREGQEGPWVEAWAIAGGDRHYFEAFAYVAALPSRRPGEAAEVRVQIENGPTVTYSYLYR